MENKILDIDEELKNWWNGIHKEITELDVTE